jgi:flagellar biosynthetic protein FliQ
MSPSFAIDILRSAFWTTFWVSLPLLAAGFLAGILVSLLQIVTSMQDSAFGTVPRLAAFFAATLLFMPWMLSRMMAYTSGILADLGRYAR